ncbi:hypothetical protein LJC03_05910 [Methanobrevibacter sp. OttesenSCG-928-I08]|nr:hypothetical protein [Methanobrevibacter sp. OttesenSCG-928-I08]
MEFNNKNKNTLIKMTKNKKLIDFSIGDIDKIQELFYVQYDVDYWINKVNHIKFTHDNAEFLIGILKIDNLEKYKRMLRTELHFTYFQMIETLFELIFAITEHEKELWLALTFSNNGKTKYFSKTYEKIQKFSKNELTSPNLSSTEKMVKNGKKINVPLLILVLYSNYWVSSDEDKIEKNFKNIMRYLKIFAKDFSDRGEYNAYKHSLRLFNSYFSFGLIGKNSEKISLGESNDSINYLEQQKIDGDINQVQLTRKPFDFNIDFERCNIIYFLIKNIIVSRKHEFSNNYKFDVSELTDFSEEYVEIRYYGMGKIGNTM